MLVLDALAGEPLGHAKEHFAVRRRVLGFSVVFEKAARVDLVDVAGRVDQPGTGNHVGDARVGVLGYIALLLMIQLLRAHGGLGTGVLLGLLLRSRPFCRFLLLEGGVLLGERGQGLLAGWA